MHAARPFLAAGGRVSVDGHPICASCGGAVVPSGPDRWRHVPDGRPYPRRPRWLAPIRVADVLRLPTYDAFVARYPWTALGGGPVTTAGQWHEAVERLRRYRAAFSAAARRRTLRPGENPYLDLVGILAGGGALDRQLPAGLAQVLDLPARRRELAALFSWAIPTDAALAVVARHAPLVECGAGMGYWAGLLRARGVDVLAYDLTPPAPGVRTAYHDRCRRPWTAVQPASSVAAARRHPERTLLCCWPPYGDDAASYDALRAYRGDVVIYVGEADGATGSVRFHRELQLNWTAGRRVDLPHWPRLCDAMAVYRRNAMHRPQTERDHCDECGRFVPTGTIGRCDRCFARHPPALALRVGPHRIEYPAPVVAALPAPLRAAFERSPNRIPFTGRAI